MDTPSREATHSFGSKFFSFRVDPFSEGVQWSKQEVTKVVCVSIVKRKK